MSSTAAAAAFLLLLIVSAAGAQLSHKYYSTSCPGLQPLVRRVVNQALSQDPTLGAALLRLFFHDCFVNGCDASVLLDDTASFAGEKNAAPNMNSLRGFEVIDAVKSSVEAKCNRTVSCADIVALAARDSVAALGGPYWAVYLGRRDARTASRSAAVANLPPPGASLSTLVSSFGAKGLAAGDMIALSGAHTIGQARCANFRQHIYNDTDIDAGFAAVRQLGCEASGGDSLTAPLDVQTPLVFDNEYYRNLVVHKGLLHSDQQLFDGGQYDYLVRRYSVNKAAFFADFAAAMVKMGDMSPLTGSSGEIRTNCRRWN
ncbi:peroxidase P7-like [Curcuma longa]|uniref:peroxidase P7-like n=1 Tax=Curcuma longa TaxID=136217 RepID=UPI003D9F8932